MKFIIFSLSHTISWAGAVSFFLFTLLKYQTLDRASLESRLNMNQKLNDVEIRYESIISQYKILCSVKHDRDEKVRKLQEQVYIHQRNMMKRANSRDVLAKALQVRGVDIGVGGNDNGVSNEKK